MPSRTTKLRQLSPALVGATLLLSALLCNLALFGGALAVPLDRRAPAPAPAPAGPTPIARRLPSNPTPNDLFEFYSPRHLDLDDAWAEHELLGAREVAPTPSKRQSDQPSVPLSEMGPPTFPADIPSCPKCEAQYPSISNCMGAAAVFRNATSIFNDPMAYVNVIRCACTDTFQAAFPQCLDCFQHTNQCYYLGTDPQGTGAWDIVSNVRNICGFGSALLGGVATANNNVGTAIPAQPGAYTDATTTGWGYQDQSTGAIFQSGTEERAARPGGVAWYAAVLAATTLAVAVGGWRTAAGLV